MSEATSIAYKQLIAFICEEAGYFSFLHTTNTVEKARSICNSGFQFKKFDKTSDYVCDAVSLAYMLNIRKHYGDFTVIIQINKNISHYEEISQMEYDDEDEEVFILPPQYVKGFYNRITNEIYANPLFKKMNVIN
jgi:hypothetical protein